MNVLYTNGTFILLKYKFFIDIKGGLMCVREIFDILIIYFPFEHTRTLISTQPLVEIHLKTKGKSLTFTAHRSPTQTPFRFMPPVTPSMWRTVRLADRFSPVCPQRSPLPDADGPDAEALYDIPRSRLLQLRRLWPLLANQSEDCLYLNLYVPRSGELSFLFFAFAYPLHKYRVSYAVNTHTHMDAR